MQNQNQGEERPLIAYPNVEQQTQGTTASQVAIKERWLYRFFYDIWNFFVPVSKQIRPWYAAQEGGGFAAVGFMTRKTAVNAVSKWGEIFYVDDDMFVIFYRKAGVKDAN